eukprot:m.718508 g.718508  ORF g.718508 m.718508 type:complete len:664 (-) comp22997_c0_seq1:354-2345(-)
MRFSIVFFWMIYLSQFLCNSAIASVHASNVHSKHCLVPLPFYKSSASQELLQHDVHNEDKFHHDHSLHCLFAGLLRYTDVIQTCTSREATAEGQVEHNDRIRHTSEGVFQPASTAQCCFHEDGIAPSLQFIVHTSAKELQYFAMIQDVLPLSDSLFWEDLQAEQKQRSTHSNVSATPWNECAYHAGSALVKQCAQYLNAYFRVHNVSKNMPYTAIASRCALKEILPVSSILVINRRHSHRLENGRRLSQILNTTYVDDFGSLSLRRQLEMISSHRVILSPVGNNAIYNVAKSEWQTTNSVPTSMIIVCPPYQHCNCGGNRMRAYSGECRQESRDMGISMIAFEYRNTTCDEFCDQKPSTLEMLEGARVLPLVPKDIFSRVLSDRVLPNVRSHCLGSTTGVGSDTNNESSDHVFKVIIDEQECKYSILRHDRTGAVIHDMLMAHAYAQALGARYCGAVGKPSDTHSEMIETIGLAHILKIVPTESNSQKAIAKMYDLLPSSTYNKVAVQMMDEDWMAHIRSVRKETQTLNRWEHLVVVHVRRGDVTPERDQAHAFQRYLPNAHFLGLIAKYRKNTSHVVILSESRSHESFDEFKRIGCELVLDGSVEEAWKYILSSDVFIMSKSSFSFVPAMLSNAVVVYTEMWHSPLQGWIVEPDVERPLVLH